MADIPLSERFIEAADVLGRLGIDVTHMTVTRDQFDALDESLGALSTWRWGKPYIAIRGAKGVIQVRRPA